MYFLSLGHGVLADCESTLPLRTTRKTRKKHKKNYLCVCVFLQPKGSFLIFSLFLVYDTNPWCVSLHMKGVWEVLCTSVDGLLAPMNLLKF